MTMKKRIKLLRKINILPESIREDRGVGSDVEDFAYGYFDTQDGIELWHKTCQRMYFLGRENYNGSKSRVSEEAKKKLFEYGVTLIKEGRSPLAQIRLARLLSAVAAARFIDYTRGEPGEQRLHKKLVYDDSLNLLVYHKRRHKSFFKKLEGLITSFNKSSQKMIEGETVSQECNIHHLSEDRKLQKWSQQRAELAIIALFELAVAAFGQNSLGKAKEEVLRFLAEHQLEVWDVLSNRRHFKRLEIEYEKLLTRKRGRPSDSFINQTIEVLDKRFKLYRIANRNEKITALLNLLSPGWYSPKRPFDDGEVDRKMAMDALNDRKKRIKNAPHGQQEYSDIIEWLVVRNMPEKSAKS